jgi:hypothetical protein
MRASIEQTWFAQRRTLAAGLLTGVALVAAVVLSRRVAGDASALTSQLGACFIGLVGMAVSGLSAMVPGILGQLSRTQRLLAIAFSAMPGLVLGLALLPSGSAAGLVALLALFGLTLGVASFCDTQFDEQSIASSSTSAAVVKSPPPTESLDTPAAESVSNQRAKDSKPIHAKSDVVQSTAATTTPTVEKESDSIFNIESDIEARLTAKLDATRSTSTHSAADTVHEADLTTYAAIDETESERSHPSQNPNTVQWLSRVIESDQENLEGVVTAVLVENERQVAVHIPFVPAFGATPEFECEPIHGESVDVRITQLKSYGVRLEIKRPKEDMHSPLTVQIGYVATCDAVESAASAENSPSLRRVGA